MSEHDAFCDCLTCADDAAAAASRMVGDGVSCTGFIHCRCHECRAEERHLAEWAERRHAEERAVFEASMKGAARLELEELLEDRWSDPEARRGAFEAMGGCDE